MLDNSQENVSLNDSSRVSSIALPSDTLARRRMLLSSLSKGSVVLAAAAVPMHSLASVENGKTIAKGGKHYHAKVSRCASPIGSQKTGQDLPECKGYGRDHYKNGGDSCWPKFPGSNNVSCRDKIFKEVFSNANGTNFNRTFGEIVNSPYDSAERRWVLAYCNAIMCPNTFPYTHDEVALHLWKEKSGSRTTCQQFFSDFCESMS